MKTPTDHIFQLISSMTAAEKRYFKRHYSSEKSLITSLFDVINGQSEYNEDEVKGQFGDSKLSKNLKVYKVQLTDILLKSLVSYHNKKSVQSKIRMGLEEIDILMEKQLFDIAHSKVKRIKDICIKNEAFEHIFPILAIEQYLVSFYSANQDITKKETFKELSSHLNSVSEIFQLQHTSHILSDLKNHILTNKLKKENKELYQNLLKTELKKLDQGQGSIREQYYRHHVISMIYRMVDNDLQKENEYKNKQVELLKNKPDFIEAYPKLYFASLYNYLSSCWKLRKYDKLEEVITEINTFLSKKSLLEPNHLFVYYLETSLFYVKGFEDFDETFESNVMKHIRKHKQETDYLATLIYLHFAIIHMIFERHKKVQFFLRRLSENLNKLDAAFEPLMYIIELIGHYQSGDYAIAQNLINSHLRKQKRNPIAYDNTFSEIILFFQTLIKTSDLEERSKQAYDFELIKYNNMSGSLRNLLEEYGFSKWLISVKEKVTLKTQFKIKNNDPM